MTTTTNEPLVIIGIDPDTEKSGFAIKEVGSKAILSVSALPFFDVIEAIRIRKATIKAVYIDAGWLVQKSNFHEHQGTLRGEKIAKNVGACHQVGKLIAEYCKRRAIPVVLVKPTSRKVTPKLFERLQLWHGRINQDCRDAVMLIANRF